jgi:hypothetical protein
MFKQISFTLLVSILLWSCKTNNTDIGKTKINTPHVSIEIDTIVLKTQEQCVEGLIFNDMYYVYSLHHGYNLSVFDKNGTLHNSSHLPDKIDRVWMLEYAAKNDSLFVLNENMVRAPIFLINKQAI